VKRRVLRALLALTTVTLLSASRVWATSNAEALATFAEAQAAFDAEDFSKARALFERAQAYGMEGPAIHYNIGAASYLGGDLPRAEKEFREVANTPAMAALAYYNLGLVAVERRDAHDARDWFERAVQESPDHRLTELASRRLAELPEQRAPGSWNYYTRGGIGYDDNVALRSSSIESTGSGDADTYGELLFAGSYSFGAWRIDTAAAALEYMKQHDYSQSSFSLGASRGLRLENWYFEAGVYGAQLSLGGEVFERNVTADVQASHAFYGGSRLRALARVASVQGKGDFEGLTGRRTEFGLYYDKSWRAWNFGAHTRAELNDSEDPIFETRWFQLGGEARYAFSPLWGFLAGAALRRIDHAAQDESLASWNDNRATLQLGLTRALWKQAQLFVRLEHERNQSPVAGYDYDRSWIAASVETWK
jgi:tetratricopeptide (TPR) repeat protein